MAMNATVLKTAIKNRIEDELNIDLSEAVPGSMDILLEEIIKHIQDFAVTKTQVATVVTTAGTLTPPAAVASTGTGSQSNAPGTIE